MIRRRGAFLLTLPAAAAFFVIPAEAQTSRGTAPARGVSSAYEAQLPPGYWLDEEEDDLPVRRGYRRQLSQNPAPVGVPNRILSSDERADAAPLPPPGLAPQDVPPPSPEGAGPMPGPGGPPQSARPPGPSPSTPPAPELPPVDLGPTGPPQIRPGAL